MVCLVWEADFVVNPGLHKAVYLSNGSPAPGFNYALWDPKTNQVLWQRSAWNGGFRPVWNTGGTLFAVSSGDENELNLFVINNDGIENQLTYLGNALGLEISRAGALDWSPNGQQLAFWLVTSSSNISVIDVKTKEIKKYCIEGQNFQLPIWSPDGNWLALNSPIDKDSWLHTRVILLNVKTQHAYEILRENQVIGWMQGK